MSSVHDDPVAGRRFTAAAGNAGGICFWHGGSLWLGEGQGRTQSHAHHAHQLVVALSGDFRFRTGTGAWEGYQGAFVPSQCVHQFDTAGATMAHVFVEPESRTGRALAARLGTDTVVALPPADMATMAGAIGPPMRAGAGRAALVAATQEALRTLAGTGTEMAAPLDPRLEKALDVIRARIRDPIALPDIASAVALSESRLRHLFVAQTGTTFRAWLLWLRINLAIEAVLAGASWTDAAHQAGFADSAHLSRTHKRLFGIEPTAIRGRPL